MKDNSMNRPEAIWSESTSIIKYTSGTCQTLLGISSSNHHACTNPDYKEAPAMKNSWSQVTFFVKFQSLVLQN